MDYEWIKAFHVAAAIVFSGGLLIDALGVAVLSGAPRGEGEQRILAGVRRWDRLVTAPAIGLVWILGLTLAVMGSWQDAPWLMAKFAIVAGLSGLHGALTGNLRRMAADAARPGPRALRHAGPIVVAGVIAIAILVVTKPF